MVLKIAWLWDLRFLLNFRNAKCIIFIKKIAFFLHSLWYYFIKCIFNKFQHSWKKILNSVFLSVCPFARVLISLVNILNLACNLKILFYFIIECIGNELILSFIIYIHYTNWYRKKSFTLNSLNCMGKIAWE